MTSHTPMFPPPSILLPPLETLGPFRPPAVPSDTLQGQEDLKTQRLRVQAPPGTTPGIWVVHTRHMVILVSAFSLAPNDKMSAVAPPGLTNGIYEVDEGTLVMTRYNKFDPNSVLFGVHQKYLQAFTQVLMEQRILEERLLNLEDKLLNLEDNLRRPPPPSGTMSPARHTAPHGSLPPSTPNTPNSASTRSKLPETQPSSHSAVQARQFLENWGALAQKSDAERKMAHIFMLEDDRFGVVAKTPCQRCVSRDTKEGCRVYRPDMLSAIKKAIIQDQGLKKYARIKFSPTCNLCRRDKHECHLG